VDVADVDQSTIEKSGQFEQCEVVARLRSFDVADVLLRGREGEGTAAAATEVVVLPSEDDGAWMPESAPHGRDIRVGQQVQRRPLDPA
jgi:hypothetical protein